MSLSIALIFLVALLVVAVAIGLGAFQANKRRVEVLSRAGFGAAVGRIPSITLRDPNESLSARVGTMLERVLPEGAINVDANKLLVQAGFESSSAPAMYAALRILSALVIPGAMFAWGPHDTTTMLVLSGSVGIALGLVAPPALLERMKRLRQERIRRSIPDCLDLLLVCVEAGVSLDAAILRVGREMVLLHTELSNE